MAFTSVREILGGIAEMDKDVVKGVSGIMLFDMSGEDGGKWTLKLKDDEIQVEEGETAAPDVTFSADSADFVAIANGELNPVTAFMQGKIKVTGNLALAMQLQNLLT